MSKQAPKTRDIGSRIDRAISVVAPQYALRRMQARGMYHLAESYRGATTARSHADWSTVGYSADSDVIGDLSKLRARSRDLVRNDGYAAGIIRKFTTNVIGSGIRQQSKPDWQQIGISEADREKFIEQAERVWQRWSEEADAAEILDFYELQELAYRQYLENGEAIAIPVQRRPGYGRRYGLKCMLVESDRLSTPSDISTRDRDIRGGVEVGNYGQPKGYWIRKTHPGDYTSYGRRSYSNAADNYRFYPSKNRFGRRNVIHLFHPMRAGQHRGVPLLAPILSIFRHQSEYLEAELVASRIGACYAMMIKRGGGYGFSGADYLADDTDGDGNDVTTMEPGMMFTGGPDDSLESFTPNRPNSAFDQFIDRNLRTIASAVGATYEVVASDYRKLNYASGRLSLQETRAFWRAEQRWFTRRFCHQFWAMLIEEAWLNGEIDAPDFYANQWDYSKSRGVAPGWPHVDPQKEIGASIEAINNNLTTYTEEMAQHGRDFDEVIERRVYEQNKLRNSGLTPAEDTDGEEEPENSA